MRLFQTRFLFFIFCFLFYYINGEAVDLIFFENKYLSYSVNGGAKSYTFVSTNNSFGNNGGVNDIVIVCVLFKLKHSCLFLCFLVL